MGVETRLGSLPNQDGTIAGQSILYFQAPSGLQFEAITYPTGMAYEKAKLGPTVESKTVTYLSARGGVKLEFCLWAVVGTVICPPFLRSLTLVVLGMAECARKAHNLFPQT